MCVTAFALHVQVQMSAFPQPVVIGVCGVIAALYLAQAGYQLGLVQVKLLRQASALQQVETQHGKAASWRHLSKGEDVKLPVALCILHRWHALAWMQHLMFNTIFGLRTD